MSKVHEAVCAMLADVEEIKKTRDNKQQGYKFRGIDDVYNAVHPLLAKHKVFPACEVLETKTSERETKAGGSLFCVHIKAKYTFWAEDGSSVATEALGEGMDSADKASNKAMSSAYKYALFQLLCIPTEAVDSENDSYEVAPQRKAQEIAKAHGMTTGDKVAPPAPGAWEMAADLLIRATSIELVEAADRWIVKQAEKKLFSKTEWAELGPRIAARAIQVCNTAEDFAKAEGLIREAHKALRITEGDYLGFAGKLEDTKETKLAVTA